MLDAGDAADGTTLGLSGVAGAEELFERGEYDGLAEPDRVGLGDRAGAGDRVGAVAERVWVGVDFVAGWSTLEEAGVGRTTT